MLESCEGASNGSASNDELAVTGHRTGCVDKVVEPVDNLTRFGSGDEVRRGPLTNVANSRRGHAAITSGADQKEQCLCGKKDLRNRRVNLGQQGLMPPQRSIAAACIITALLNDRSDERFLHCSRLSDYSSKEWLMIHGSYNSSLNDTESSSPVFLALLV